MIYSFSKLINEAKFKIKKTQKEVNGKLKKVKVPQCVDSDGNKLAGWKAIMKKRQCVKMSSKEIQNREKGQVAGARKREAKMAKILLKKQKLAKKRDGVSDITESSLNIKFLKDFIRKDLEIKILDINYDKKAVFLEFANKEDLETVYGEVTGIDEIMSQYNFELYEDEESNYYALRVF